MRIMSTTNRSGERVASLSQKTPMVARLQLHLRCGLEGSLCPCHPLQCIMVLSYHLPGTHRRNRMENHPTPFTVHSPIFPKLFNLSVQLLLFQNQPLICRWNSELLSALHGLQMPPNDTARFTPWPLAATEYPSDTSHLASFTCSSAGEMDVHTGNGN